MNDKIRLSNFNDYTLNFEVLQKYFVSDKIQRYSERFNIPIIDLLKTELETKQKITYNNSEKNIYVSIDYRGVKPEWNPNVMKGKLITTNDNVLTYSEFIDTSKYVESELNDIGINCSINDFKIFSYHSCFDTEQSYNKIKPMLKESILPFKDAVINERNGTLYIEKPSEINKKNNSDNQKISIYDRSAKIEIPIPITRYEYRMENQLRKNRILFGNLTNDLYWKIRNQNKEFIHKVVFSNIYNLESLSDSLDATIWNKSNSLLDYLKYNTANRPCKLPENITSKNRADYERLRKIKDIQNNYKITESEILDYLFLLENQFKDVI